MIRQTALAIKCLSVQRKGLETSPRMNHSWPIVKMPTYRTTNKPTNLTEMAPASIAPVAVSQIHQEGVKGSRTPLNCAMVNTDPEMKKRSMGSRRMYLLRMRTPMSKIRKADAMEAAVSE